MSDPSGLIVPGVRVIQSYGGTNQPAAGHTVWGLYVGTDFMVLGQHVIPTNTIAP